MLKGLLPIGSVIEIKGQLLMIVGYIKKGTLIENEEYDYIGCDYPTGIGEKSALIKKSQIEKVRFVGYQAPGFMKLKKDMDDENE
jgi:hypothetical protein